jgi:hypothetical protein
MKRKSVWLIAWEGSERQLARIKGPQVLAFIDSRKGASAIREILLGIYLATGELTPKEKCGYALTVEGRRILIKSDAGSIRCGLNPCITARLVEDLRIEACERGQLVRWKQPLYRLSAGQFEYIRSVDREEIIPSKPA